MVRNNAEYKQAAREWGGLAFAVLFFLFALGMWLL